MIHSNKSNGIGIFKLLISIFIAIGFISFSIFFPERYLIFSGRMNYYSSYLERLIIEIIPSYVKTSKNNIEIIALLKTENNNLNNQIKDLNSKYLYFIGLQKENQELRSLLNIKSNSNIKSITTSLVTNADYIKTKTFGNTIILPLGEKNNIQNKSLVITSLGVVGYITNVYSTKSVIRTFLDSQFKLSAFTEKSKYNVIISGNGTLNPDITVYSKEYFLKENELVSTSGLEGIFPRNIPIGTVFKDPSSQTWKIKLFTDYNSLSYVFIVR